jgi:hypothetical protein
MAAFKQFNTNEVVITPFHANKDFNFIGPEMTGSNVEIEFYQCMQGPYISGSYPTGFTTRLDQVLVFNNIKQLYYSNYLTSSRGDTPSTASLIPGASPEYNSYNGLITGPRFDNFLQTSEVQNRNFSQFSSSTNINGPTVMSIPSNLFGEKIPCGQFNFTYTSSLNQTRSFIYDDSEGNLITTQSDENGNVVFTGSVGQIFYSQGIAIFTNSGEGDLKTIANNIGAGVAGVGNNNLNSCSLSFSSSITIRENQYKCTIRDSEYTYTQNNSALRPSNQLSLENNQLSSSIDNSTYGEDGNDGTYELSFNTLTGVGEGASATIVIVSNLVTNITILNPGRGYLKGDTINLDMEQLGQGGSQIITSATGDIPFQLIPSDVNYVADLQTANQQAYYDFATGSYFSPYVTTVGLYNESYQLIAVGKLSQPIPISLYTDTTFIINFDT